MRTHVAPDEMVISHREQLPRRRLQSPLPALAVQWSLGAVFCLALALRLFRISGLPLEGDEYGSLNEATWNYGANLTSLLYFTVLRGVLHFSNAVWIVRLPAVVLGVAAVGAMYGLASTITDRRTGLVASLLLATSSYAIGASQQVRFYSFFLLTGILAVWALALVFRDGASRARIVWLIVANLLCLTAQPLGILVVAGEGLSIAVSMGTPLQRRRRVIMMALAGLTFAGALGLRAVRVWGFHLLATATNAHTNFSASRGIHVSNFVKVGFTAFAFTFGEYVYPLWVWITIPGAIVAATLFAYGLWTQRHNRMLVRILLPQLLVAPVLLYLVLDAITPNGLQGASPRYVIPLLGPYLIVIAAGITSWRRQAAITVSLVLALALNGTALGAYWTDAWSTNGYAPDWPRVAKLIDHFSGPRTVVLVDGRTEDPSRYYFKGVEQSHHVQQESIYGVTPHSLGTPQRIIAVTSTDRPDDQTQINNSLDALQTEYRVIYGFVRYPLFAYVLDRHISHPFPKNGRTSTWTPLSIPISIYDLSLEDLLLPFRLRIQGIPQGLVSRGAMTLSPAAHQRLRTLTLPHAVRSRRVVVATTLQNDGALPWGRVVASITLSHGNKHAIILLRKGFEVDNWRTAGRDLHDAGVVFSQGYSWLKLISIVGQRSYADAYRQFDANIVVSTLSFKQDTYTRLTVRYLAPVGTMHIWGMALRAR